MPTNYRRTLLKQELARKLYPDSISPASSLQQLRREINLSPTLKEQLEQAGNTRKHYYNIKQVQLIMAHLGIDLDELDL